MKDVGIFYGHLVNVVYGHLVWTLAAMHIVAVFFSRRLLWSKKTGHEIFSFFPSIKKTGQLDKQ
jgi:hypothetical protein